MSSMLRVEGITKRFPGVIANDRLSFQILPGEIHAVVGENGAGKSTLMNILYGLTRPDEGAIYWHGQSVTIASPQQALALGIGMVHQHFLLVHSMTVLENVTLGLRRGLFSSSEKDSKHLRELARSFGQSLDPNATIDSLSVGEQQRVEIFKALYRKAELLILDEPTASLTPNETAELFAVCRRLREQGRSVVFITHRLDEVCAVSDRVSVLRHGHCIATLTTSDTGPRELARLMVGEDVETFVSKAPARPTEVILSVTDLHVPGEHGRPAIDVLSLTLRRGEIVGIAGIDGNGQSELIEVILGLLRGSSGNVKYRGKDITQESPSTRVQRGISIVPADRYAQAIVADLSMLDNLLLGFWNSASTTRFGFIRKRAAETLTQRVIAEFRVKVPSIDTAIGKLSGGHQQRFVLGRTIAQEGDVIIAAQPTRGLDLLSVQFVHRRLIELRDAGRAILLVSMDLDEIRSLSDRIEVIHDGRIVGSASSADSREEIGLMMAGMAVDTREGAPNDASV